MSFVCVFKTWGSVLVCLSFALCVKAEGEGQSQNPVSFAITSRIATSNSVSQQSATNTSLVLEEIVDAKLKFSQRLRAASSLSQELNPDEIACLYNFLESHVDSADRSIEGIRALKNEIMNALRQQTEPPARFTDLLMGVYNDAEQDEVIRDYSVQHLGIWCQQGIAGRHDQHVTIGDFLQKATQDENSISGTALIALHRLSQGDSDVDDGFLNSRALALASSGERHVAVRISAIQICSERGIVGALPTIEALISTSENVPLRLSAIAALGRLGEVQHLAKLQEVQDDSNQLVRIGVRKAQNQIKHRLQLF